MFGDDFVEFKLNIGEWVLFCCCNEIVVVSKVLVLKYLLNVCVVFFF